MTRLIAAETSEADVNRLSRILSSMAAIALLTISSVAPGEPAEAAAFAVGPGVYEDSSPSIELSGAWSRMSSGSDSGGGISVLSGTGFARIAFNESKVSWLARKTNYFGIANVYLDDMLVAEVDLYSPTNSHQQVVYESPTLERGLHTLRVERSGSKNNASSGRGVNVDAFVVADTAAPATPTGLTSAPYGNGIELAWSPNSEPDLAGYQVWRAQGDGDYSLITPALHNTTTFTDGGLTPGTTYSYRIAAIDTSNNSSPHTPPTTTTTAAFAMGPGVYEDSSPSIELSGAWSRMSSGSDSGGGISVLSGTGFARIAFNESKVSWLARKTNYFGIANVYLDDMLVAEVDLYSPTNSHQQVVYESPTLERGLHTLRVERSGSKNNASSGRGVNVDAFVVADTAAPATPTGLTSAPYGNGIELAWSPNSEPDLAGYQVWRAQGDGDYSLITPALHNTTTFTDGGLTPGTTYSYRIAAIDTSNNSSPHTPPTTTTTAVTSGVYGPESGALAIPADWSEIADPSGGPGVVAVGTSGVGTITFNESRARWIGPRWPQGGTAKVRLDGEVITTVNQYAESAEPPGVLFESPLLSFGLHRLSIEPANGAAGISRIVVDDTVPPSTPVWAEPNAGATSVELAWRPSPEPDVHRYHISRISDTGSELIGVVESPSVTYMDQNLQNNHSYAYTIEAQDRSGNLSPPADAFTVSTAPLSGTIENTSSAVSFAGVWSISSSASDSAGSVSTTTEASASAKLTFSGTGIKLVARKNSWSGIATVSIDGNQAAQVDLYAATATNKVVVWQKTGLDDGSHTVVVARSGVKNDQSQGRGINIDAFVVTDSTAPSAPDALSASTSQRGARLTWSASSSTDTVSYRVYRRDLATNVLTVVDTIASTEKAYLDAGLLRDRRHRFYVSALDSSGNESRFSPGVDARMPALPSAAGLRYADCPAATVAVSTSSQLVAALSNAQAGDVIRMSPGVYSGAFTISASGTDSRPVWICGPRTAVIDQNDVTRGYGVRVVSSKHIRLAGFTVQNSQKGLFVQASQYISVADLAVRLIGDEAIHLLSNTSDSTVAWNLIDGTGKLTPAYGEGVYVGSDPSNWCTYSQCSADRSDRNIILGNTIRNVTAEGVEAKAGTTGGVAVGNNISGAVTTQGDGWIVIKGDEWLVESNSGTDGPADGYRATLSKGEGWGYGNVFTWNDGTLGHTTGYGIWVQKGAGHVVDCSNAITGGVALSNVGCQR